MSQQKETFSSNQVFKVLVSAQFITLLITSIFFKYHVGDHNQEARLYAEYLNKIGYYSYIAWLGASVLKPIIKARSARMGA